MILTAIVMLHFMAHHHRATPKEELLGPEGRKE
jgi:hypothetical protein